MGSLIDLARKLRPIIEQAAQSLDDKTASDAPEIFGGMRYDGGLIKAGTRINWFGNLKQAAVDRTVHKPAYLKRQRSFILIAYDYFFTLACR